MTHKRALSVVIVCALGLLAALRAYRAFVPWGASVQPFVLGRADGPVLSSPDGSRRVHVYFNDAGAAHSGNHWTWFVENHWLLGRRVVEAGYLGRGVVTGGAPLPVSWSAGNEFRVDFSNSRYE